MNNARAGVTARSADGRESRTALRTLRRRRRGGRSASSTAAAAVYQCFSFPVAGGREVYLRLTTNFHNLNQAVKSAVNRWTKPGLTQIYASLPTQVGVISCSRPIESTPSDHRPKSTLSARNKIKRTIILLLILLYYLQSIKAVISVSLWDWE